MFSLKSLFGGSKPTEKKFERDKSGRNEALHSTVNILVLGDEKVGKTSLISTFVSQHFSEQVPSMMQHVQIPAEENHENVVTTIIDSSSRMEERIALIEKLNQVDVAVLVYDMSRPETLTRASSYWLPLIESTSQIPVILAGNKVDLNSINEEDGELKDDNRNQIQPLLMKFKSVEENLECSAKAVLNIQQIFYYAQKAVVYPVAPLYDVVSNTLKPKFEKALCRIFRLFDGDRDNLLSDKELNEFQYVCFGITLQPNEIASIKKVLVKDCSSGVTDMGINECGFLFLNKLFLRKSRPETAWLILRSFGYDKSLELMIPSEKVEPPVHDYGQSTELSSSAIHFLSEVFNQFDASHSGKILVEDVNKIFSICPQPVAPWVDIESSASTEEELSIITLSTWLAKWSFVTLVDVKKTLLYLFYIGFKDKPASAIMVTKNRRTLHNQAHVKLRSINCFVFGAKGCGKTSLLQSFLHQPFKDHYISTEKCKAVANAVILNQADGEKYMVLSEIPVSEAQYFTIQSRDLCDVVCLMFDPTDPVSFDYIQAIEKDIESSVPRVFVCSKSDALDKDYCYSHQWRHAVHYTSKLQLNGPLFVSSKEGCNLYGNKGLFVTLSDAAINPIYWRPIRKGQSGIKYTNKKALFILSILTGSCLVLYKLLSVTRKRFSV